MSRGVETVIFRDCVYNQCCLYFFSNLYALPMKKNLITGETNFLPIYLKESLWKRKTDLEVLFGRCLYLLDMRGQYLIKYNIDTYKASCYEIDCSHSIDGNFAYMDVLDNNIYIFTREAGKFVIFDTCKEEVKSVVYPDTGENKYLCGCKMGGSFFVFPQDGSQVLEYVTKENIWKVHKLQENLNQCVHVAVSKDKICILLADGTIFQWNVTKEKLIPIDYDLQVYTQQETAGRICCVNDEIIILPSCAQGIVRINCDSHKADIYRDYPLNFSYDPNKKYWSKYYGYCENDTEYYFSCMASEYILKIEKQSGEFSWMKSEVDAWEIEKMRLEKESIINEKEGYLEWLITRECQENAGRGRGDIGKGIWNAMKD